MKKFLVLLLSAVTAFSVIALPQTVNSTDLSISVNAATSDTKTVTKQLVLGRTIYSDSSKAVKNIVNQNSKQVKTSYVNKNGKLMAKIQTIGYGYSTVVVYYKDGSITTYNIICDRYTNSDFSPTTYKGVGSKYYDSTPYYFSTKCIAFGDTFKIYRYGGKVVDFTICNTIGVSAKEISIKKTRDYVLVTAPNKICSFGVDVKYRNRDYHDLVYFSTKKSAYVASTDLSKYSINNRHDDNYVSVNTISMESKSSNKKLNFNRSEALPNANTGTRSRQFTTVGMNLNTRDTYYSTVYCDSDGYVILTGPAGSLGQIVDTPHGAKGKVYATDSKLRNKYIDGVKNIDYEYYFYTKSTAQYNGKTYVIANQYNSYDLKKKGKIVEYYDYGTKDTLNDRDRHIKENINREYIKTTYRYISIKSLGGIEQFKKKYKLSDVVMYKGFLREDKYSDALVCFGTKEMYNCTDRHSSKYLNYPVDLDFVGQSFGGNKAIVCGVSSAASSTEKRVGNELYTERTIVLITD